MTGVRIRGDGVAARAAAHLLVRAGFAVSLEGARQGRVPCILLSQSAQSLVRDVIQSNEYFPDAFPIHTRIVQWGDQANTVKLPHAAVVLSEDALLAKLTVEPAPAPDSDFEWELFAGHSAGMHSFGERSASVERVEAPRGLEPDACQVRSLTAGWEFLISGGDGSCWRITAGTKGGGFPVGPRMAERLCGPGWLACGSGALGFDPLCGDGTAHAIREAILASAVIRAAARGEDRNLLLEHYHARLTIGFRRHLEICRQYYGSGGAGPWWRQQCAELDRGLAWCADRLRSAPAFRYRLEGFELVH